MFEGGVSKSFSIFPIRVVYMPVEQGEVPASILISVSKRRFKRAVKRNRVKRQIREAYRKNKSLLVDAIASSISNVINKEKLFIHYGMLPA